MTSPLPADVEAATSEPVPVQSAPRGFKAAQVIGWVLGNLLLVWHLVAISIAPLSVDPASPIARETFRYTGPYAQAMFMNHGYHYFAPNPGGSMMLNYEITMPDGTQKSGLLPDKSIQPRLLYHRYFMLTEFLSQYDYAGDEFNEAMVAAYAEQLLHEHQGESIDIIRVYHDVPSMQRVLAGGKLDDPDLYEKLPLGRYSWSDF